MVSADAKSPPTSPSGIPGGSVECIEAPKHINATFEELPSLKPTISTPRIPESISVVQNAIEQCFLRLKSYISMENGFDAHEFESDGFMLAKELSSITEVAFNARRICPEVARQLRFMDELFRSMSTAIDALEYYENARIPGHHIVWSVYNLNIVLLALRDSQGRPDVKNSNYEKTVRSQTHALESLQQKRKMILSLPLGMRLTYEVQIQRAEISLSELSGVLTQHKV